MAKTLLRSGDLDDFRGPLAAAVRPYLIRHCKFVKHSVCVKQQALVDCTAIPPRVNDEGDRVDWYSPVDGRSVSWKAADEDARFKALRYLESTLDSAAALSRKCMQSPKTAQQLFGSLLEKALQFPGENHISSVDGKPVITFWGFVNLNESAREDVLECLRQQEEEEPLIILPPEPEPEEEEPAVAVTFSHADEPLLTPAPEIKPQPAPVPPVQNVAPAVVPDSVPSPSPAPAPAPAAKKRRRYGLWALPVAAAVAIAVAAPLILNQQTTQAPAPEPAMPQPAPVAIAPKPIQAAPMLTASLPLHRGRKCVQKRKRRNPAKKKSRW